jgi:hypothetical protein
MVQVHRISRELADYHVSQTDFPELRRRVKHYLAVGEGPKLLLCPICLQLVARLVRDHDWATGLVRGRICERCNGNLGAIENHPAWDAKILGPRWWAWFFDNHERIVAHLKNNTGERYDGKSGVGVAVGPRAHEPSPAKPPTRETVNQRSLPPRAIAVRSPSGGGGGGVDVAREQKTVLGGEGVGFEVFT